MSYTPPWIPRADAAFLSFAASFCNNINARPSAFMMTQAEAASLMEALHIFQAAFRLASNEATRTRQTIADKVDARSILQNRIESQAAFIRVNRGITDGDKLTIGVRPRNASNRKRTCPMMSPVLEYIGSLPGMDQLVYHDSNTPTSKAKPRGAERLELWVAYAKAGEPQPKKADARPVGTFKKSKMLVPQDPDRDVRLGAPESPGNPGGAPGTVPGSGMPTYWGRWLGFDGKAGPWSLACGTTIRVKPAAEKAEGHADDAGDQTMKRAA